MRMLWSHSTQATELGLPARSPPPLDGRYHTQQPGTGSCLKRRNLPTAQFLRYGVATVPPVQVCQRPVRREAATEGTHQRGHRHRALLPLARGDMCKNIARPSLRPGGDGPLRRRDVPATDITLRREGAGEVPQLIQPVTSAVTVTVRCSHLPLPLL